jgi:hexosaminidase
VDIAFKEFKHRLNFETFTPHKFHASNTNFEPDGILNGIRLQTIAIEIVDHALDQSKSSETYRLDVLEDGKSSIVAHSHRGVMHALSTLSQLFYTHSTGGVYSPYIPTSVIDWPKFEHRGLNLDISRNEIEPKDVVRTLEGMSLAKMNRLHLHATDSQSWPIEIPSMPELSRRGAYRSAQVWSSADLRDIQEKGNDLGIDVYLEIDMPGHTSSIFHAYPDLVAAYNQPLAEYSASEPPSGQLKLNSSDVTNFVGRLLDDILPRISPYSSLFHIGGDELNTKVYELDPTVNSSSREILRPLLQDFYDNVLNRTKTYSLDPMLWEESLLDWDLQLPNNSIIQVWRSPEALASVVSKGYRALAGSASHWYLDCGFGIFLDPDPSNLNSIVKPPYRDWCDPYKNWRQIYSYNPLLGIPDDKAHLVIGGEVHLWSELTDGITLDGKLWPRAAAAAEILWTGPREVDESVTRRLAEIRERLVARGIRASVVQMQWCLQNPGQCKH